MSYDPVIIDSSDYGDIRLLLGFDAADTTSVPDSMIEARPFLRDAEADVKLMVTDHETIVDDADVDYDVGRADTLKEAVIAWTAARLCVHLASRAGSEVTSEGVGPLKVTFREGPDWLALGRDLWSQASSRVYRVLYWGVASTPVGLATVQGPTRAYTTTPITSSDVQRLLWPPVVKGYDN